MTRSMRRERFARGGRGRRRRPHHDDRDRRCRERTGGESRRRRGASDCARRGRAPSLAATSNDDRTASRRAAIGAVPRKLLAQLAQSSGSSVMAVPPSIASRSARRASCNRRHSVPARMPSTRAASTPGRSSRSHSTYAVRRSWGSSSSAAASRCDLLRARLPRRRVCRRAGARPVGVASRDGAWRCGSDGAPCSRRCRTGSSSPSRVRCMYAPTATPRGTSSARGRRSRRALCVAGATRGDTPRRDGDRTAHRARRSRRRRTLRAAPRRRYRTARTRRSSSRRSGTICPPGAGFGFAALMAPPPAARCRAARSCSARRGSRTHRARSAPAIRHTPRDGRTARA